MRILACLALVLAPSLSFAADRDALEPLPQLNLEGLEPAVASQIEEVQATLETLAGQEGSSDDDLAQLYGQLGKIHLLHHQHEAAATALRNAGRLDTRDARWPYYLGVVSQRDGHGEAAEAAFLEVLAIAPDDLATILRLGHLALETDRAAEAETWFGRALAVAPSNGAALYGLGQAEQSQGRTAEAIAHFQAASEAEPEATIVHYPLALAFRDLGDQESAEAHMALRGDQRFAIQDTRIEALQELAIGAYYHVAQAARSAAAGNLAQATESYRQALAIDPTNNEIRGHLAITLARDRQVEAAKAELRTILDSDPEDANALFLLGTALLAQGDLEGAATSLQRALAADPTHVDTLATLGTLAEQREDLASAEYNYSKAVELDPEDAENRFQHAKILALMGRNEEAMKELVAVLERDPRFGQAILSLGFQFEQAEMTAEALERYRAAAALDDQPEVQGMALVRMAELSAATGAPSSGAALPESAQERVAMANALGRLGRFEEAGDAFDAAISLGSADAGAHTGRALSRLLAGQDRLARTNLEASLGVLPDDVGLWHMLARLLATSSEADLRDGTQALTLAQQVARTQERVDHVETVAMALAELGRFEEAADLQRRILSEARRVGATPMVPSIEARLRLYESGQAVRDVWRQGTGQ